MKLHIYSEGVEFEDYSINLKDSFQLLENQSTQHEVEDNFIGFTLDDDNQAMIQFIRVSEEKWVVDIPTYEDKKYIRSLSSIINHHLVFSITRDFFDETATIQQTIKEQDYDKLIECVKLRYGIVFDFEVS
jgi:hypothetical protein